MENGVEGSGSADQLPPAILKLMRKGAEDLAFRELLLNDPAEAIRQSGIGMTPAERELIVGAGRQALEEMVLELARSKRGCLAVMVLTFVSGWAVLLGVAGWALA